MTCLYGGSPACGKANWVLGDRNCGLREQLHDISLLPNVIQLNINTKEYKKKTNTFIYELKGNHHNNHCIFGLL